MDCSPEKWIAMISMIGLVCAPPAAAYAGACTEGDDANYVAVIEELARGKALGEGDDPFYCLDLHLGQTNRWAGPRAAKKMARLRRSPLNPRLKRACARLLRRAKGSRSKGYDSAKGCVELMAARGIRSLGKTEILELQRRFFPYGGLDPGHLAALGDPRAVPQLIDRFRSRRICYEVGQGKERTKYCHDFSPRRLKRNRWARKRYREMKIAVLNALWHLAAPASRDFLKQVIAETDDALIKQRAAKVLDRVEAQAQGAAGGR